jgi:hypothetical protein
MCGGCSTSIDWLGVSILDAMMEDGGDSDGVSMKVYVVSLLSTYLLAKREEVTITMDGTNKKFCRIRVGH